MPVTIRALEPSEWRALRDLRLYALRTESGVYFSSYDGEVDLDEAEWRRRLSGDDRQVFGAFDWGRLVGISGVVTVRDDPSGESAMLVMSYLLPEYRGRGLSASFYEARLRWLRERPRFKRVVVSHRRSNEPSRRANQRFGFVLSETTPRRWPDGTVEDELVYELRLDGTTIQGAKNEEPLRGATIGSAENEEPLRGADGLRMCTADDVAFRDARDADFAALLRGETALADGLVIPPGGLDDPAVVGHVRAIAARVRDGSFRGGHWVVVADGEAVGLIGYKHVPRANGDVEIGYGIAPARRRRGYATRAVELLLEIARADPAVRAVIADTALDNVASQRALQKNGFVRAGSLADPTDGAPLIRWRIAVADA